MLRITLSFLMKSSVFVLAFCLLSGCWEEDSHLQKNGTREDLSESMLSPQQKPALNRLEMKSSISEFLHVFVLTPPPVLEAPKQEKREEEEIEELHFEEDLYDETLFGEPLEVLQPFKSKDAQNKRYEGLLSRKTTGVVSLKERKRKTYLNARDKDYKTHLKGIKEDVSSFPVDGARVITADRYIPVVLENSINSQLPGRFIGIVETHVFANEGRGVLLPKGTRIICTYTCLSKEGDTRLAANCGRAIRPDGASVLLTNAYAADQMARTGAIGVVDNRMWTQYGSAFIVAGISALAAAGANTADNSVVSQSASNLSVNLGQITSQMLEKNADLAPVMTVAAGSRLQIIPMTDIWVREPEEVEENETSSVLEENAENIPETPLLERDAHAPKAF